jgi:Fe-Mn family superoxide dismutase
MAFKQLTAKPLKPATLSMEGISKRTMEEHFKLYQGYVNKYNEIMQKLETVDRSTANQTYSDLRELKLELSFALGGVKNHEIYFNHLGGKGGEPGGKIKAAIERDFGSVEKWREDLKQTGIAARGWVWVAYDYDTQRLFNYLGDAQNAFPIWNAGVVLALDTYEHAYFIDYGVARGSYIDAFFKNLDWSEVEKAYDRLGV